LTANRSSRPLSAGFGSHISRLLKVGPVQF
jgi:hypothetical protein